MDYACEILSSLVVEMKLTSVYLNISEHCYKRVAEETKLIQTQIKHKLGDGPIKDDVIVLYEGENLPEKVNC